MTIFIIRRVCHVVPFFLNLEKYRKIRTTTKLTYLHHCTHWGDVGQRQLLIMVPGFGSSSKAYPGVFYSFRLAYRFLLQLILGTSFLFPLRIPFEDPADDVVRTLKDVPSPSPFSVYNFLIYC